MRKKEKYKICFLSSNSKEAKSASKKLKKIYSGVSSREANVIVALGGDGFALSILHKYMGKNVPIFGMNCGTVGFLMNDFAENNLINRLKKVKTIDEIILALSTTMEGETTNFYLYKKLIPFNLKITTMSRGVSIGDELEYTDEITLGRSLVNRQLFENTLQK